MKKILKAGLLLFVVLFCNCMFAETLYVTDPGDDGSVNSLRGAIAKAEEDLSGKSVVELETDVSLTQGVISTICPITIEGNKHTIQFSAGSNNNSVFKISTRPRGTTTIKNLTIYGGNIPDSDGAGINLNHGNLVLDNVIVRDGTAALGGGIYVKSGTLTLQDGAVVLGNTATTLESGGGIGGGVYVDSDGKLIVNNSSIYQNIATGNGGGIYVNSNALITIDNSTVESNHADMYGGGIYNSGTLNVLSSKIDSNTSYLGGGIYVDNKGTVNLDAGSVIGYKSSALSGIVYPPNSATCGGGIYVNNGGKLISNNASICQNLATIHGSGIFNKGALDIIFSTIDANRAGYEGAGIYNDAFATATITNSAINNNIGGSHGGGIANGGILTLVSSTVSNNSAGTGGGIYDIIGNLNAITTILSSTVTGNIADSTGAGIRHNTGSAGSAGNLYIANSIIAYNYYTTGSHGDMYLAGLGKISINYVISGTDVANLGTGNVVYSYTKGTSLFSSYENAVINQNPEVVVSRPVLADNGGPTQTIALADDSIASGSGVKTGEYTVDEVTKYAFSNNDGTNWYKVEDGISQVTGVSSITTDQRGYTLNFPYSKGAYSPNAIPGRC